MGGGVCGGEGWVGWGVEGALRGEAGRGRWRGGTPGPPQGNFDHRCACGMRIPWPARRRAPRSLNWLKKSALAQVARG